MILVKKKKPTVKSVIINIITFKWLFFALLRLYKVTLHHIMGKSCKYMPTCSTYMYQAIDEWGTIRGIALGSARLARCNPFSKGGLDRVPFNPRGEIKWLR